MARAQFEPGRKVERIGKALLSPRDALTMVGSLMAAESARAFDVQEYDGKRWEPRAPVNVFGIIADFAAGKRKPPNRRFERRDALIDTGALSRSITFELLSDSVVQVGTALGYASVHQTGGDVESEPITDDVRALLLDWLRGPGKRYRRELGWLLNRKFRGVRLEGTVPQRKFVGITKRTRDHVRRAVQAEIAEA